MTRRPLGGDEAAPLRRAGCMLLMVAALAWPGAGRAAGRDDAAAAPAPVASTASAPNPNPDTDTARPGRLSPDIPLRRDGVTSDAAAPAAAVWPPMLALAALGAAIAFWTLRSRRARGDKAPSGAGIHRSAPDAGAGWPAPLRAWLSSRGAGPMVRLLGSQRITARHSVHVLQWRGREYLLGCGEQGLTVVDSRPVEPGDDAAAAASAAADKPGGSAP